MKEHPEERSVRADMQAMGRAVGSLLPEGWGFFVLCFKFGDNDVKVQYVSNGAREEILRAMQEFIDRNQEILPRPDEN